MAVEKTETKQKTRGTDILFSIQIVGMIIFTVGQFMSMLKTVQGISPAWLICAEAFCVLSFSLAYLGWKKVRSRATFQLLITHFGWMISVLLLLILLIRRFDEVLWGWYDTLVFILVGVATFFVILWAIIARLGISDPVVRGVLAGIYRGFPHIALAYKIFLLGGNGLALATVFAANFTACVRIWQLLATASKEGWDRSRKGLLFGESINEVTWILVTVVWLLK